MTDAELEAYAPPVDLPIDPGIRRAVLLLRSEGVDTLESCEGGEGHPCPEPIIRFIGGARAARRAVAAAVKHSLPVMQIRYAFTVVGGTLEAPCWEMVFSQHGFVLAAVQ